MLVYTHDVVSKNCGGSLLQQFYLKLKRKNWLKSIIFISSSSMSEWFSGKEFSVSYLLFRLNCRGSVLQQFYLELKRKSWLKSIIFISSSSMREWSSGKEFSVS